MDDIHVRDLMSATVVSITPETGLAEAIQAMLDNRYSCLVVVEGRLPVGIITERDIVRLLAEFLTSRLFATIPVAEVMSAPVVTVTEDTTLFDALVVSNSQKIRHLPVVDGQGRMTGLVTQSDLAQAHFRIFERQREIIERSVHERTRELQQANDQLRSLSMVDALTGIGNRRAMQVDLDHTHPQAVRYKRAYSVALFDVDYFKLYNDCYGHQAGDAALRRIAEHLQASIRKSDRLYRYGGEEILLLMPETSLHGALILAERILEGLAGLTIAHRQSPLGHLTLSCGVACQTEEGGYPSWEGLVDLADRGLYAAKRSGRNRVTIIPPEDATDDSTPRFSAGKVPESP
jgi:diguanylate cyclase (GGDEF)-like protein